MPAPSPRGQVPQWYYVAGVGVIAAGYLLIRSRRAATSSKAPVAAATPVPVVPAVSTGAGQNAGALQNISAQLQNLQAAQAATAGSAARMAGITATAENSELAGAGYRPRSDVPGGGNLAVVSGTGGRYQYVADPTQRWNAFLQGLPIYYQPVPGVFSQVKDFSQIPATTPFFLKAA